MIATAIEHLAQSMQSLPLQKTIALTATLDAFEGAVHAAIKMKADAPEGMSAAGENAASSTRKAKNKGFFGGGVTDAITALVSGGGSSETGSGKDIVLVLNNREFGRAVDAHLAKKHNLSMG